MFLRTKLLLKKIKKIYIQRVRGEATITPATVYGGDEGGEDYEGDLFSDVK